VREQDTDESVVALPLWSDNKLEGATREQAGAVLWVGIVIARHSVASSAHPIRVGTRRAMASEPLRTVQCSGSLPAAAVTRGAEMEAPRPSQGPGRGAPLARGGNGMGCDPRPARV